MADLLALSSRIIDSGDGDVVINRVTHELSELTDGIAMVEAFSHVVLVRHGDGLAAFDVSNPPGGRKAVEALRAWSDEPVTHMIYTHGHLDHVGGSAAFVADAEAHGRSRPQAVAHEKVPVRFDRYRRTKGWNLAINKRQFGWIPPQKGLGVSSEEVFLPDDVVEPDVTYATHLSLELGGMPVELHHAIGETDDHTWAWLPEHRAICAGDFLIWNFPNAGNPQKVQRYPEEWAVALRSMAAMQPELLLPAHGLPIEGAERIARVLDDVATALEDLCRAVVDMMNAGCRLDEIVHTVKVPADTLAKPYLRPFYDEPEFVIRNVWRRYGGWWDLNPATLKPAPEAVLATEMASLAGGAMVLARRAVEVADAGDLRLACHLAELAGLAAPLDRDVHELRAQVYERRRQSERSLMAKGIYAGAVKESTRITAPEQ